ncbi:MAG: zinc ribbon domain-containing protein [Deltaproteobacteria bacterium]|nr:zinc ribbon domain-containing protein [Deltaproteobacteria bacterium]
MQPKPKRPKLRCPACEEEVTLPATFCPECGVELRTAYLKKKSPKLKLKTIFFAGIQLCVLAFVLNLLWKNASWNKPSPSPPPPSPAMRLLTPEERRAAIAAAPPEFHRLAEENPILLLPYIYVYRAKTAVVNYQEQFQARYRELEKISGLEDLATYQKATPGQRQLMLRDLFGETQEESERRLALFKKATPAQRERMLRNILEESKRAQP